MVKKIVGVPAITTTLTNIQMGKAAMVEFGIEQEKRFLRHKRHDYVQNQKKRMYKIMEVVGISTKSLITMRVASALRLFEIELALFGAPSEDRALSPVCMKEYGSRFNLHKNFN